MSGEELADHYRYMLSLPDFREIATKQLSKVFHYRNLTFTMFLILSMETSFSSPSEAIPEAWDIFKRFTAVFEQTYTRFLDLQKAEAQAKEAQIEAALEKVRSRSLAMHKSDELQEVINCVFDRLNELNIETDSASILVSHDNSKDYDSWIQNSDHSYSSKILIPNAGNTISLDTQAAKELITDFSKIYTIRRRMIFSTICLKTPT